MADHDRTAGIIARAEHVPSRDACLALVRVCETFMGANAAGTDDMVGLLVCRGLTRDQAREVSFMYDRLAGGL